MNRITVLNNLAVWHSVALGEQRKEIINDEYWGNLTEESLKGKLLLIDEEYEDLRSIDDTDEAVISFLCEDIEDHIKQREDASYKKGQQNLRNAMQQLLGINVDLIAR